MFFGVGCMEGILAFCTTCAHDSPTCCSLEFLGAQWRGGSRGAAGLLGLFADPVNREVSPPPRKATPPIAEPFGGSRTPASTV